MTPPRPLWKSVQDYVLIAIGMISYAIGWNVFLLPTNVTASGLPGISSIIYWATGCPVQIPYFIVNATLLICAFKILGAKFCVKTVYAVIVVTFLTSFFSSRETESDSAATENGTQESSPQRLVFQKMNIT